MSREKDEKSKSHYLAVQRQLNPGETAEDRLNTNLALIDTGWNRIRNEKGEWAYFPNVPRYPGDSPEQRALEDEWQVKSLAMHSEQQPLVIADKPIEETMTGRGGFLFNRATEDEAPDADRPVPNFHESPASMEVQRRIRRGD